MFFCTHLQTAYLPRWPGHIQDLHCVRLSTAAPFCENYAKLYFDVKHLEKELNRGRG